MLIRGSHLVRPLATALVFAFGALLASPVCALTDDEKAALRQAVEEGSEAYGEGDFPAAVEAFERAQEITDNPRVKFNLARALEAAGLCERSRARFGELAESEDAEKLVKEKSREKLDEGLDCTPTGTVAFTCETPQAQITLGGERVACGESVRTEAAPTPWSASAPGYLPVSGEVTPVEGETTTVVIGLSKPPPPKESKSQWKLFAGIGTTIAGAGALAVGVVSDSTADDRSTQIIDAAAAGDTERLAVLQDQGRAARTRTVVLYSAGATLTVGGAVLLFLHFSDDGEETSGLTVAPTVTPDGGSVTARWRW